MAETESHSITARPSIHLNAHIHIGTCAWTHEDWLGSFYPADLPGSRWLAAYARVFNAVEIDSTFYELPAPGEAAHWLAGTPAHFRFTCLAPQAITHQLRLRDCERALEDFLESIQPLHARLGAILFHLPPSFTPERDGLALRDFVLGLPHGWKFVIDFSDPDWHHPRFVKLLEDHGVCWAWSDTSSLADQDQAPFGILPETADFLYVRLLGDLRAEPGGDPRDRAREGPPPRASAIESWAVRLQKQAEHVRNVYILCGNRYEGFAPATCRELGSRLGLDFALPPGASPEPAAKGPRQMELL